MTDSLIFTRASLNAGTARERMLRASEEVSSGLAVVHPGDGPAAAGLAVLHGQSRVREDAILQATGRASDEVGAADGALDGLGNLLSRARELAVQLSNDSYSADERANAASEIDGLFQSAIGLLNTQSGGRYLFGGSMDATPPFDATGAYLGDVQVRSVEIAPGQTQEVSIRADVMAKGTGGGADALATLQALSTALSANDAVGIRAALDPLDSSIKQVATGRAQLGAASAILGSATEIARAARDAAKVAGAHEVEADAIESMTRLAQAERALDASLSSSAKSFKLTLLDKL
ncbi:MAG: flagellar biosynthesis protein FlgL [Myxococcales bacterium]